MQREKQAEAPQFEELVSKLDKQLTLDCLGGQGEAKERLRELTEQLRYSSVFSHWDSSAPKGTLLVGPPGTGKTHAVRCLANEVGCFLVEIRYEDIASMWVDRPIELLKDIKKKIEDKITETGDKVIVFLDEAEVFMPTRDTYGLMMPDKKKTNFFLMWLDGGLRENKNIFFIAATNHEKSMDPAARRDGRFENRIAFEALDIDGVIEVFQIHIGISEGRLGRNIFGEIDWNDLRSDLVSLTGAEAAGVIKVAKRMKAREHREALEEKFQRCRDDAMSVVGEDLTLDMLVEGERDLVPDIISTETMRAAIQLFIDDKNKKDSSEKTVVRGFSSA